MNILKFRKQNQTSLSRECLSLAKEEELNKDMNLSRDIDETPRIVSWFVSLKEKNKIILVDKSSNGFQPDLNYSESFSSLLLSCLKFMSATDLVWKSKKMLARFLPRFNTTHQGMIKVFIYDDYESMKPLRRGEKSLIFSPITKNIPGVKRIIVESSSYPRLSWTILIKDEGALNRGNKIIYDCKGEFAIDFIDSSSEFFSVLQDAEIGVNYGKIPLGEVFDNCDVEEASSKFFREYTQFPYLYILGEENDNYSNVSSKVSTKENLRLFRVERKSPLNDYVSGLNPTQPSGILTYCIMRNAPYYKYPEIEKVFRERYWKSIPGCDRKNKVTFSTKNSFSVIIDWIDGLATDKRDLSILMKGSPFHIPSVSSLRDIGKLPKTDRYIMKPAGVFSGTSATKDSVVFSKGDDISDMEAKFSREGYVIQPYILKGENFLDRPGRYILKVHGFCFIRDTTKIPEFVFSPKISASVSFGEGLETTHAQGTEELSMSTPEIEQLWKYVRKSLKDYCTRQKLLFLNMKRQDEKAVLHITVDLLTKNDDLTEFYILEVNRQAGIRPRKVVGDNFNEFLFSTLYTHEKLLRAVGSGGEVSTLGDGWVSFY